MDATLRNLFSRRKSEKHGQLEVKAHPYERTVKQTSPIKGTRPIAGNGPYRLENIALQSQELGAEPPHVPRSRQESLLFKPRTAPLSAQFDPNGRTRSGFSNKAPSTFSRNAYEPSLTNSYHDPLVTQRVRSVSAFSSDAPQTHNQSAHVDLLDAVSRINPSVQTYIRKRVASGKQDYGEDVADRNIAEFGGDDFPQHDTYSNSADDTNTDTPLYSRDELNQAEEGEEVRSRLDGSGKLDWRGGSTRDLASQLASDGAGDDIPLPDQQYHHGFTPTSLHTHDAVPNPSKFPSSTTANSHARRESGHSHYSNANGMRGSVQSGQSSSASTDAASSVAPALPWSNAITSANLYYTSGGLNHAVYMNESLRETANSSQPIQRLRVSRGTQTNPSYPEHLIIPSIVPAPASGEQDAGISDSDLSDPPPILRSALSRRVILPTPPMSPITGGSPTTSIPRASLDKELPPPPPEAPAKWASDKNSPGGSASYPIPPLQDGRRGGQTSAPASTITAPKNFDDRVRPTDGKRNGIVGEGASEPPRLDGIVDLSNTADTEIITTRLPAVVHEHVTPTVHHIREERISREIHNHDVFHRVQPIIDVEVLPTKHYVPSPNGNGLIEVPESQLPGRHTKWAVQPLDNKAPTPAFAPSRADVRTTDKQPEHLGGNQPIVQSSQKTVTEDGISREETVWRHPTQLENGAYATGQTVPLTIAHDDAEDEDENYDTASERYAASDPYAGSARTVSTRGGGEEELLYRDSDLAFDGRLPGLEEANPVVSGSLPASRPSTAATTAATVATRRAENARQGEERQREAELAAKMGQLRVAER